MFLYLPHSWELNFPSSSTPFFSPWHGHRVLWWSGKDLKEWVAVRVHKEDIIDETIGWYGPPTLTDNNRNGKSINWSQEFNLLFISSPINWGFTFLSSAHIRLHLPSLAESPPLSWILPRPQNLLEQQQFAFLVWLIFRVMSKRIHPLGRWGGDVSSWSWQTEIDSSYEHLLGCMWGTSHCWNRIDRYNILKPHPAQFALYKLFFARRQATEQRKGWFEGNL